MTSPSVPVPTPTGEQCVADDCAADATQSPGGGWRVISRYPPTLLGLVLCLIFLITAAIAPLVCALSVSEDWRQAHRLKRRPRSIWFGIDEFGRDVFSRVLYGPSQISLRIGLTVSLLAGAVSVLIGLISGYVGGWWTKLPCASPMSFRRCLR